MRGRVRSLDRNPRTDAIDPINGRLIQGLHYGGPFATLRCHDHANAVGARNALAQTAADAEPALDDALER